MGTFDENLPDAGADPEIRFVDQLRDGPVSWHMFLSCVGFAIPGMIHLLYFHEHVEDYMVGMALLLVAVSSTVCDAYCVHSAPYDSADVFLDEQYHKTGIALGTSPAWVADKMELHKSDGT